METPITVNPAVWEDIHRAYVREHITKAIDLCDDIMNNLAIFAETGRADLWKDTVGLINLLGERAHRGSLSRVRAIAYYYCDNCKSDLCDHAVQVNG